MCSAGLAAAAGATRRLSTGLLFLAGGTRTIDDFKRDVSTYFADYNLTPGEIQVGLNALETRMYGKHGRPGARICVIGCGSGRDLLPFLSAGHEAVGIEAASQPLDALRRELADRGQHATLMQGFVEDAAIPGAFDLIILSPHCYSYIPGTERRVAVLRRLAGHLTPDGRVAISFLRRTGTWSGMGVGLARWAGTLTGSDCPWEPHDVVQSHGIGGRRAMTFEHYFLPSEVEAEVSRAGLRVIDAEVDDFLGPMTIAGR